ncbi:MAG: pteridine-dependent deoxygenase [Steroidobacter sp.]
MQEQELADASWTRGAAETDDPVDSPTKRRPAAIQVRYYNADQDPPDASGVLAVVHFGSTAAPAIGASIAIGVDLAPVSGSPHGEYWLANGSVHANQSGRVRYAHDDHCLFAVIEQDEQSHGGIGATAASVYNEMQRFQQSSPFPHLLRMWNYLDDINEGAGDLERYREFCVGRVRGLGPTIAERLPAATAIGRQRKTGQLQVFWLAGRRAGAAVENPRQVSAYRYPRVHGPVSPSFSRATRAPDGTVLISGTASIVGHVSQHHDNPLEQFEETLRNLAALTAHAGAARSAHAPELFKVYVRDPAYAAPIEQRLSEVYPGSRTMLLEADICRRELAVEIEGVLPR